MKKVLIVIGNRNNSIKVSQFMKNINKLFKAKEYRLLRAGFLYH